MKKKIVLLSLFLIVLLSSCKSVFEEKEKTQNLTIINNTNLFIKYSIIKGTTTATSSKSFYSQSHDYLVDWAGFTLKQEILCPSGTKSGEDILDRFTYILNKDDYYLTIFVCKNNDYTNQEDVYINKYTFSCIGDTTITIGRNGALY